MHLEMLKKSALALSGFRDRLGRIYQLLSAKNIPSRCCFNRVKMLNYLQTSKTLFSPVLFTLRCSSTENLSARTLQGEYVRSLADDGNES